MPAPLHDPTRAAHAARRLPHAIAALASLLALGCGDDGGGRDVDTGADVDTDATDAVEGPDVQDVPTEVADVRFDVVDAPPDVGPGDPPLTWGEPVAFEVPPSWLAAHPDALARISGWATDITDETRPPVGALGGYGTGNGHVFALIGYGDPLNSLHSLAGPTYEKHDGFFGDYALSLVVGGEQLPFLHEQVARSLASPAVLTRGDVGGVTLDTLDFAPWTDGPERYCFARMLLVRNDREEPVDDVRVRVTAYGRAVATDTALVEQRDERSLTTYSPHASEIADGAMDLGMGSVDPGGSVTSYLLHCAGSGDEGGSVPAAEPGSWLDATAVAYAEWREHLAEFTFPDPLIDDFVEGMKLTLITQTAATGGTSPMSQYTRTWARDNIGPVLAWHAFGGFEEARRTMDYVYGAVVKTGDLANSYAVDLDLSDLPDPPDWDAMPPLSGRVAAETPSYMVWIYGEHARVTGDIDVADDRWGFLRRALLAQAFSDDDLLPFTDDETYRAAMNAAFGIALEYPHAERNDSANSSLLWLGASRHLERLARSTGRDNEADAIAARRDAVEAATVDTFLLEDGCFAAYRERSTGDLSPPFEDVGLKVTWAGWLGGDAALARRNVACLVERISPEPGVVRSPIDPFYENFPAVGSGGGVLTGMLPGYTLSALTAVGHPDGEAALAAMGRFASPSGNFQEYIDAGAEAGLQLLYDRTGAQGDYTSKYRPWEGGINLAAVIDHLFGVRVDAVEGTVSLRPHLPTGWPSMEAEGLRIGDERFDVSVRRDGVSVVTEVTSRSSAPLELAFRWDSWGSPESLTLDGVDSPAAENDDEHFGGYSARIDGVRLEPGESVQIVAAPR